jgi:hypothetical protein
MKMPQHAPARRECAIAVDYPPTIQVQATGKEGYRRMLRPKSSVVVAGNQPDQFHSGPWQPVYQLRYLGLAGTVFDQIPRNHESANHVIRDQEVQSG